MAEGARCFVRKVGTQGVGWRFDAAGGASDLCDRGNEEDDKKAIGGRRPAVFMTGPACSGQAPNK
jgi:hypothetical protein